MYDFIKTIYIYIYIYIYVCTHARARARAHAHTHTHTHTHRGLAKNIRHFINYLILFNILAQKSIYGIYCELSIISKISYTYV